MIINAVKNGLKDGDVNRVRQALAMTAYMANAKAHESFKDSIFYAEQELNDLYEVDNGAAVTNDDSPENYIAIANLLTKNFSKEKTEMILSIGEAIFEKKVTASEKAYDEEQDFFGKKLLQIVQSVIAAVAKRSVVARIAVVAVVVLVVGAIIGLIRLIQS